MSSVGASPTRNSVCTPGGEVTQQVITVAGKIVYTTLEELVSPNHTALVVMDMQRDFCSPGGVFDRRGIDISMYPALTERVAHLLRGARDAGVTVIYVCMTVLPNRASESPAQIRFNMRLHQEVLTEGEPLLYTVQGSKGADILPELTPRPDELIISKYRSSGFWGTNLDLILRSNGIESMVLVGCTTEGCVESTARDALFNDYYVIVPEDCIASDDPAQHDASLLLMRHRFDVVRSEAVLAIWSSSARYVAMEG